MASPTDWSQFYQHNMPNHQTILFGGDATAVTTTTATSGTVPSGTSTHLNPEGRVGKPIRRRSRASRRTPTTLLNTDTSNFRAMVQQFTGGPSAPFANPSNYSFGGVIQSHPTSNILNTTPLGSGGGYHYNIQYAPPPPPQQAQQNRPYMFQMGGNSVSRDVGYVPRSASVDGGRGGGGSEGFGVAEGVSSEVPGSRTSNLNRNDTFMY